MGWGWGIGGMEKGWWVVGLRVRRARPLGEVQQRIRHWAGWQHAQQIYTHRMVHTGYFLPHAVLSTVARGYIIAHHVPADSNYD